LGTKLNQKFKLKY